MGPPLQKMWKVNPIQPTSEVIATRAAVGGGPYGGDWNVSMIVGRVAGDGDPYGGGYNLCGSSGPVWHPTFAAPLPPSYEEGA